jgi:flagellin
MGTFSILNNISALNGQHQLNLNTVNLNRTLNRMASGMRINSGADDAAGLQIADTLRANVYALNQAVRNANDGLSFLQIADGALSEITNMLTRMVTLAEEGANEPIDARGREALNNEFQELQAEIARLSLQTNFNGTHLFKVGRAFGDTLDLFVGDISGNSSISVVMGYVNVVNASFDAHTIATAATDTQTTAAIEKIALQAAIYAGLTGSTFAAIKSEVAILQAAVKGGSPTAEQREQYEKFTTIFDSRDKITGFMRNADTSAASLATVTLLTHASAASAIGSIRDSLNEISNMRGTIGAGMNRLQAGISVMQTQSRNTLSAESSIRDANMAEEITSMTKYQILAQTGIAALAHSNANSQTVLRLLQ